MFKVDAELFYSAQTNIEETIDEISKIKVSIDDLLDFPKDFEFKSDILKLVDDTKSINKDLNNLLDKINSTKDMLCNLDNDFAVAYYNSSSNKFANLGSLNLGRALFSNFSEDDYDKYLLKHLDELNSSGNLPQEYKEVYKTLQNQKELNDLKKELELLNKNKPNRLSYFNPDGSLNNPANILIKNSMTYEEYYNKKNKLEAEIKQLEKNSDNHVNNWKEDINNMIDNTKAVFKKGVKSFISGKGISDLNTAFLKTGATTFVLGESVLSKVSLLTEKVVHSVSNVVNIANTSLLVTNAFKAAGATWLLHDVWTGDNKSKTIYNEAKNVFANAINKYKESDDINFVQGKRQNFYEDTKLGQKINEYSNIKYDSAASKKILYNDDLSVRYIRNDGSSLVLKPKGNIELNGITLNAYEVNGKIIYTETNLTAAFNKSSKEDREFLANKFLANERINQYYNKEFGYIGFVYKDNDKISEYVNKGLGNQILNESAREYYDFLDKNRDIYSDNSFGVDQHVTMDIFKDNNILMSSYLIDKIRDKGLSYADSVELLRSIDSVGACTYASMANEILAAYHNKPETFYKDFGFPMYLDDGFGGKSLNTSELLADMYLYINTKGNSSQASILETKGNSIYINERDKEGNINIKNQIYLQNGSDGRESTAKDINNYLKSKNKNLSYNTKSVISTMNNYGKNKNEVKSISQNELLDIKSKMINAIQNNKLISLGYYDNPKADYKVNMYDVDNGYRKIKDTKNWGGTEGTGAGHSVYVTTINEYGVYCSSWGKNMFMTWDDLKNVPIEISVSEIGGIK